jgi:hypothetical protein
MISNNYLNSSEMRNERDPFDKFKLSKVSTFGRLYCFLPVFSQDSYRAVFSFLADISARSTIYFIAVSRLQKLSFLLGSI